MLTIRSGVPLPALRNPWRADLEKLEVHQCIDFDGTAKEIAHFRIAAFRVGARLGRKFTVRADPFSGVTCWRIA